MKLLEEKNAMTGYDTRDDLTTKQSKYCARQKSKRKKKHDRVDSYRCALCNVFVMTETRDSRNFEKSQVFFKKKKNIQRTIF